MFDRAKRNLTIQMLASLDPAKLQHMSEAKALKTFETTAQKVPAYSRFLKENNVSPSSIKTIDDFKKHVPIIDKDKTFRLYSLEIKKLCLLGEIKDARMIVSSSGHSGCFSYGINTHKEIEKSQEAVDFVLDYIFDVAEKKTLLINCLAMGVKIHSALVTVVDTSVRPDIVIGVIKTFAPCYDQIIIVGENSFVKKVFEDGINEGLDWNRIKMHLILGEEILPENLRTYFAEILGVNPDDADNSRLIGSSFGVAEFGLNLFYETKELIRIRRLMQRDKKLKEALVGLDLDNLPVLFQYDPTRIYAEEMKKDSGLSDLVLTNLEDDTNIPLVRYNIKDEGKCIAFGDLKNALESCNYGAYVPKIRAPLMAIWGRDKIVVDEGFAVRPEFVKELLYQDRTITRGITGNFKLSKSKAGLRIEIQAKQEANLGPEFEDKIRNILLSNIHAKTEIIIYPYREFPHGMELNYEKKFQYI